MQADDADNPSDSDDAVEDAAAAVADWDGDDSDDNDEVDQIQVRPLPLPLLLLLLCPDLSLLRTDNMCQVIISMLCAADITQTRFLLLRYLTFDL